MCLRPRKRARTTEFPKFALPTRGAPRSSSLGQRSAKSRRCIGAPHPGANVPFPTLGETYKNPEEAKRKYAEGLRKSLPPDKEASLKRFDAERRQFLSRNDGTLPTHPAMADAVAGVRRDIAAAHAKFKAAVAKALADYDAIGVKDAAHLQPVLAQQEMIDHADLAGVWERTVDDPSRSRREVWFVYTDPETGQWRVEGIDGIGLSTGTDSVKAVYHGDQVELKDGGLWFTALEYDTLSKRLRKDGERMFLIPRLGRVQIRCDAGLVTGIPKPAIKNGVLNTDRRGDVKTALMTRRDVFGLTGQMAYFLNKAGIEANEGDGFWPVAASTGR